MEEEKVIVEQEVQDQPINNYYLYGNLIIECGCGAKEVVEYALKDGIQVLLRTSDHEALGLKCATCGASLTLKFEESSEEQINNKLANEVVSEGSEEDQTDMGISISDELVTEPNL